MKSRSYGIVENGIEFLQINSVFSLCLSTEEANEKLVTFSLLYFVTCTLIASVSASVKQHLLVGHCQIQRKVV